MSQPTGPVVVQREHSLEPDDATPVQELAAVWHDLAQVCADIQRRLAFERKNVDAEGA